jgi:hypothetical protein
VLWSIHHDTRIAEIIHGGGRGTADMVRRAEAAGVEVRRI